MKLEKAFDNFIPFIPIIYLFLNFIPGFIYKIIFGIILFACLIYQNSKERIKFNKINIAIIFLFFYLIGHFLLIESYVPTNSILLIYNSFMLFSLVNLIKKEHMLKVSKFLMLLSIVVIVIAIYEAYTGNYTFGLNENYMKISIDTGLYFPLVVFYNFGDLAYFLLLLSPFSMYYLYEKFKNIYFCFIYIFILFFIAYLTESTFTILAVCGYVIFFVFISLANNGKVIRKFSKHRKKLIITLVACAFGIFILILPTILNFLNSAAFTIRVNLLSESLNVIKQNLLFGVGVEGWQYYMDMRAHNFFLNISLSVGLIGTLPVAYLYCLSAFKYLSKKISFYYSISLENIIGFSIVVFAMINMIPGQSEYHFVTWMFLSLSIAILNEKDEEINK